MSGSTAIEAIIAMRVAKRGPVIERDPDSSDPESDALFTPQLKRPLQPPTQSARIAGDQFNPYQHRRVAVPLYLGRFSYSSEAIKGLVESPQDRGKAAAEAAESVGAKLLGIWFALGEFDGVFLTEAPDNATALALAMLVGASGAIAKTETTVLLTMDEAQEAMRKASGATFRPPS